MKRKMTEDFIGTCQACFGEFKVNENSKLIVLHGYKRPGWGSVHGQCEGTDNLPFEYDTKLTVSIIKTHRDEAHRQSLLQSEMSAVGYAGPLTRRWEEYNRETGRNDPKSEQVTPGHDRWSYTLKSAIQQAITRHQYHLAYANHLQKMVSEWKRGKIVGIDVPATGLVRPLRKAYDPEEAKAQKARDAEKAARLAKPGKLKVVVWRKEPDLGLPPGHDRFVAFLESRKQFVDGVRTDAKTKFTGKLLVREESDYALPNALRRTLDDVDVAVVHIPWEYREEITKHYPGAVRFEDAAKKVSYHWNLTRIEQEG